MLGSAPITTLHLWRVAPRFLPWALTAVARDRRRIRAATGLRFAKLLGTSRGFGLRDADPLRWLLVSTWDSAITAAEFEASPIADGWYAHARESWRATLQPVAGHGRWAGREPFGSGSGPCPDGAVVALTRARLALRRAPAFWRAVRPVAAQVRHHDGLLHSLGFGEAPVGYQGTLSVWSGEAALRDFTYGPGAHHQAIAASRTGRWFAEDLFWRFAVLDSYGTIDGCDPLSTRQ